MVSAVLIAVAVVVLGGGAAVLWRFEIQYAAEIQTVTSPHGRRYDILVHRDGVMFLFEARGRVECQLDLSNGHCTDTPVEARAVALGGDRQAVTVPRLSRPVARSRR